MSDVTYTGYTIEYLGAQVFLCNECRWTQPEAPAEPLTVKGASRRVNPTCRFCGEVVGVRQS